MILPTKFSSLQNTLRMFWLGISALLVFFLAQVGPASASVLPLPDDTTSWSDINATVYGKYDALGNFTILDSVPHPMNPMIQIPSRLGLFNDSAGSVYNLVGLGKVTISDLVIQGNTVTSNGILTVSLNTAIGPYMPGELLTADIDAFLFTSAGNLQLGFNVTGGQAADRFGGVGGMGGINLYLGNATVAGTTTPYAPVDFSQPFDFVGMVGTQIDILGAPVPEPGTFLVFGLLGCCVTSVLGRRRTHRMGLSS